MDLKVVDFDGKELQVYSATKIFNDTDVHFVLIYNGKIRSALLSQDMIYDSDNNLLRMKFLLFNDSTETPQPSLFNDSTEIPQLKSLTKKKKLIEDKEIASIRINYDLIKNIDL